MDNQPFYLRRQEAGGRRQEAGGRRQRQEAEGRRQRQEVEGKLPSVSCHIGASKGLRQKAGEVESPTEKAHKASSLLPPASCLLGSISYL